jgi:hypothetical protein
MCCGVSHPSSSEPTAPLAPEARPGSSPQSRRCASCVCRSMSNDAACGQQPQRVVDGKSVNPGANPPIRTLRAEEKPGRHRRAGLASVEDLLPQREDPWPGEPKFH